MTRRPGDLLAARLAAERANPRPLALRHAERMIVQGLSAYGFGHQYQVTHDDYFEIAVDDLIIRVTYSPDPDSDSTGAPAPDSRVDTCPVHAGTLEPCPECESKIAAGL